MDEDWQADLERWLAPYLEGLGNKTRRRMCPAYIAGLIGPGDRKSIQPMAARSDAISYDRLHHFIGAGLWDSTPLEATLWGQADKLVGGDEAWLIIDDTPARRSKRRSSMAAFYTQAPNRAPCACQLFTGRGSRLSGSQRTETLRRAPGSMTKRFIRNFSAPLQNMKSP